LLLRTNKYKENLAIFQGKEQGSIKILQKYESKKFTEKEKFIKDMIKVQPFEKPCIEDLPYVDFDEGILALMWHKKRG